MLALRNTICTHIGGIFEQMISNNDLSPIMINSNEFGLHTVVLSLFGSKSCSLFLSFSSAADVESWSQKLTDLSSRSGGGGGGGRANSEIVCTFFYQ